MFAAIIKAELGWQAVLVNKEGKPNFVSITKWGLLMRPYQTPIGTEWCPLNDMENNLSERLNFVMVLGPGGATKELIQKRCDDRIELLKRSEKWNDCFKSSSFDF